MHDENDSYQKCAKCGKAKCWHSSKHSECPSGRKHRVLGYMQFGPDTFEPYSDGRTVKHTKPKITI